jgi:complement component 1 Q subcomponent-binding protein
MIDDFYYFKDSSLTKPTTLDAEKQRGNVYTGPPFGNLDEELQNLLDQYLADRGVDEMLAEFVAEYIDSKEQKEYVSWLEGKRL